MPGLLTALIARPPVFGGKVKSFNADKAKAIAGVKHVIQTDRGIAVVAEGFWPAKLGRDALEIVWDEGALATLDSKKQTEQYAELANQPGAIAKNEGDTNAAKGKAIKKMDVVYDLPYLAHAPMEPLNCVADVKTESCEIWVGTQFQTADLMAASRITGLKPNQIKLHTTLLGGGFGRRAVLDSHFVTEAVQVSKAIQTPVKVVWTREDDIRDSPASKTMDKMLEHVEKEPLVTNSWTYGTPPPLSHSAFVEKVKEWIDKGAAIPDK